MKPSEQEVCFIDTYLAVAFIHHPSFSKKSTAKSLEEMHIYISIFTLKVCLSIQGPEEMQVNMSNY